jgi:hypothetical protein
MLPYRPIISYDTSAINRLLNDPDSSALVSILKSRYYTRITSTNIEEIIANSNIHRRQQLRDFIKPLAATGECFNPTIGSCNDCSGCMPLAKTTTGGTKTSDLCLR